jgi:hypothetical protein
MSLWSKRTKAATNDYWTPNSTLRIRLQPALDVQSGLLRKCRQLTASFNQRVIPRSGSIYEHAGAKIRSPEDHIFTHQQHIQDVFHITIRFNGCVISTRDRRALFPLLSRRLSRHRGCDCLHILPADCAPWLAQG